MVTRFAVHGYQVAVHGYQVAVHGYQVVVLGYQVAVHGYQVVVVALFGDVTPQGLGTNYQTRKNGDEGGLF